MCNRLMFDPRLDFRWLPLFLMLVRDNCPRPDSNFFLYLLHLYLSCYLNSMNKLCFVFLLVFGLLDSVVPKHTCLLFHSILYLLLLFYLPFHLNMLVHVKVCLVLVFHRLLFLNMLHKNRLYHNPIFLHLPSMCLLYL